MICIAADCPDTFDKAKIFAKDLVLHSMPEKTTTYLHSFVYHFRYFLEQHGGLEFLSNYSTEGMVGHVKRTIATAAPKFGGNSKDQPGDLNTVQVVMERIDRTKHVHFAELPAEENSRAWFRHAICNIEPTEVDKLFTN